MSIVPADRPKLGHQKVLTILSQFKLPGKVHLLGVRGYYKRTMGDSTKNDRGIYDDAIFLVSPEFFGSYNANTDPSVTRDGVFVLNEGTWFYQIGKHKINSPKGYPALVQADKVTGTRDNKGEDSGWFGINIHKGSVNSTSSLGCQTVYPDQWDSFFASVKDQLSRYEQKIISYTLIEEAKLYI